MIDVIFPSYFRAETHVVTEIDKSRNPGMFDAKLFDPQYASPFKIGDYVKHSKFGRGRVTETDGAKLTITFESGERKRVVDSFVTPG